MALSNWLFYFLLSFILGIALRSFWEIPWHFFGSLGISFLAIALLSFLIHKKPVKIFLPLALVCLFLSLGIVRFESSIFTKDELKVFRDTDEVVTLEGVIKGEPDLRDSHIKYTLLAKPYNEKVLINAPLSSDFGPGDKIEISGKLQTPGEFPDFNYKDFLLKDGVETVSYYPEIKLLEEKNFSFLGGVLKIKDKLRESNSKILPFPQSEILAAMTLGDSGLLPEYVKESFSKTGIRHIVAISGMHIAIIIGMLSAILSKTKLNRWTFLLVSLFLIFYVILVGYPASAVRAGIMGSVLLLADNVRRKYFAERALCMAAFVMLLWNPLLLKYDVGFQLSFLAVLGILLSAPFFEKHLKFLKFEWLKKITAITLAAQVFTLPILIYNFGIFSTVSPLANILVVPLLPLVMFGGFLAMISGIFSEWLGIFLAFPVYLILKYIIFLSDFLADLPWTFSIVSDFHLVWMLLYYAVLFPIFLWMKRKPKVDKETQFDKPRQEHSGKA